jgi:hypothetical protein
MDLALFYLTSDVNIAKRKVLLNAGGDERIDSFGKEGRKQKAG